MSRVGVFSLRQFLRSGLFGLLMLGAVNLTAAITGVSLGFGWLSGGAAAILGAPGVVGMLLLNALFLMP